MLRFEEVNLPELPPFCADTAAPPAHLLMVLRTRPPGGFTIALVAQTNVKKWVNRQLRMVNDGQSMVN